MSRVPKYLVVIFGILGYSLILLGSGFFFGWALVYPRTLLDCIIVVSFGICSVLLAIVFLIVDKYINRKTSEEIN